VRWLPTRAVVVSVESNTAQHFASELPVFKERPKQVGGKKFMGSFSCPLIHWGGSLGAAAPQEESKYLTVLSSKLRYFGSKQ